MVGLFLINLALSLIYAEKMKKRLICHHIFHCVFQNPMVFQIDLRKLPGFFLIKPNFHFDLPPFSSMFFHGVLNCVWFVVFLREISSSFNGNFNGKNYLKRANHVETESTHTLVIFSMIWLIKINLWWVGLWARRDFKYLHLILIRQTNNCDYNKIYDIWMQLHNWM